MIDASGIASALTNPNDTRMVRLGIVEAQNLTAVPPTLTVDGRVMRYVSRVPLGQTAVYLAEGRDPLVVGKMSEGDDGIPVGCVIESFRTTQPPGWLFCNGQSTAGYPALAAEVGPNVPDMRDRFPVGAGGAYALKASGGASTVTLSTANLPSHSHNLPSHSHSMNNHTHDLPFHSHSMNDHTHDLPFHKHTIPSHGHSFSGSTSTDGFHSHTEEGSNAVAEIAQGGSTYDVKTFAQETGGAGSHFHSVSGSIGGTALSTDSTDPGATGGASTASTGSTDPGATGGASTASTGSTDPGATGAVGSGASLENRPPYRACHFLIRAE